jgi:hypothetical protein
MVLRLVQFTTKDGARAVAALDADARGRIVNGVTSAYDLARKAIKAGVSLEAQLADLGLGDAPLSDLKAACAFACRPDSDLHNLPFAVSSDDLLTALVSTTTIPVASPRQR